MKRAKPIWRRSWYVQKESWKIWFECTKIWVSLTFKMLFGDITNK